MRVNLKRDWFGPGGVRYRANNNPNTIQGVEEADLPPGAEIVGEEKPKKAPAKEPS